MAKLKAKFRLLEDLKNETIQKVSNLTIEKYQHKLSDNDWSLIQVLNHIIDVERGTCGYVFNKLTSEKELPPIKIKNKIASFILNKNLKSDKKFKAPAIVSNPSNSETLEQVLEKWDETRFNWQELIETFPRDLSKKAVFRHPLAGNLNILQTLEFMYNHLKHHQPQIEKLI